MIAAWERTWDEFVPFLKFDAAIRKVIYTTDAIESMNFQLRRSRRTAFTSRMTTRR